MVQIVKVPPDGGHGWMIVIAAALSNVVVIPLMQNFGLIYRERFTALGLSGTECSLIININSALGMLVGLVNGLLLKMYGYRKMAYVAATLVSLGMIGTAFSTSFAHFIISYGVITSLGMGLGMAAFSLALNSYFKEKRDKAVAFSMTITGLGPIIMPQLMTLLMKHYNIQGTTLILSAVASHSFVSATLLQPVKWHMKKKEIDQEAGAEADADHDDDDDDEYDEKDDAFRDEQNNEIDNSVRRRRKDSIMSTIDYDIESANIYGLDSTIKGSVLSLHSYGRSRRPSLMKQNSVVSEHVYNTELSEPIKKKPLWRQFLANFSHLFDFDLLRDPIYVNIMLGMSFAIFAELNFSVLTPFILSDLGLDIDQSATFLSVLGVADIIFRFLAPYIGGFVKLTARPMYTVTLIMLMATRFSLLISGNIYSMMVIALGLGIAKGVRTVYMSLVIPNYVPLEKLPSASGIQMMVNGVCILIGGPLLGVVRDLTGSYTMCIVIMNCVTLTTVIMWTVEGIIVKSRERKKTATQIPTGQEISLLNPN